MSQLFFFVAGEPKPQPRPKVARIGGFARAYTPYTKEAKAWRSAIIAEGLKAMRKQAVFEGPLRLDLEFVMARPKSHFTKKGLRPQAPDFHIIRPDHDNLAKMVMDAMGEAGVWADDCQVCYATTAKRYTSSLLTEPGCHIKLAKL